MSARASTWRHRHGGVGHGHLVDVGTVMTRASGVRDAAAALGRGHLRAEHMKARNFVEGAADSG